MPSSTLPPPIHNTNSSSSSYNRVCNDCQCGKITQTKKKVRYLYVVIVEENSNITLHFLSDCLPPPPQVTLSRVMWQFSFHKKHVFFKDFCGKTLFKKWPKTITQHFGWPSLTRMWRLVTLLRPTPLPLRMSRIFWEVFSFACHI